jgi:transcriptional regulator with XRE-family HTH domain
MPFHPTDVTVGKNVRALRERRGVSQENLARTLGISFQQVQKYEKGANRIAVSRLVHIAVALDTPVDVLFAGVPEARLTDAAASQGEIDRLHKENDKLSAAIRAVRLALDEAE